MFSCWNTTGVRLCCRQPTVSETILGGDEDGRAAAPSETLHGGCISLFRFRVDEETQVVQPHAVCKTHSGHDIANLDVPSDPRFATSAGTASRPASPKRSIRIQAPECATLGQGGEDVCSLAWVLSTAAHITISKEKLMDLHQHIQTCADVVGAEALSVEAGFGMLRSPRAIGVRGEMSDADIMLRLGQLLCRFAAAQQIGFRVGVHFGKLHSITLPLGKTTCFGPASAFAMQLATLSEQENMVHLSTDVKERLNAFRTVRLVIGTGQSTYYLDPMTAIRNYYDKKSAMVEDETMIEGQKVSPMELHKSELLMRLNSTEADAMRWKNVSEFSNFLQQHAVDVSQFGKGTAKSLVEFYEAVATDRKSSLEINEGTLERVVNLVRISLRMRDKSNHLRELRIASEATQSGGVRKRDQKFAVVLKNLEKDEWQQAVEKCFVEKLQLPVKLQKACFATEFESYAFQEDRSASSTIPGIMTHYRAHNIVINIRDQSKRELTKIGLPEGKDFSVGTGDQLKNWTWAIVGDNKEDELLTLLHRHGVDTSDFPAQSFAELCDEVYGGGLSTLEVINGDLTRTIKIVKVWLHAQILNVDHVLLVKAKWQKNQFDAQTQDLPISMRMSVEQDWMDAVEEALTTRLGLNSHFQKAYMSIDLPSHQVTEEIGYSRSYPGLKTLYVVNEVRVHIVNSDAGACRLIGLPNGTDFTFARREQLAKSPGSEDVVVTHWCWKTNEGYEQRLRSQLKRSSLNAPSIDDHAALESDQGSIDMLSMLSEDDVFAHRVERPKLLVLGNVPNDDQDAAVMKKLMKGMKADWKKARNAAQNIRNPKYSCKNFFEDVVGAFPELKLYCLDTGDIMSSGRTADDEYQRTIGALFAVFWMMRLDEGDGRESFCFGLDKQWAPHKRDNLLEACKGNEDEVQKRIAFYDKVDWKTMTQLLLDAGLLEFKDSQRVHNEDRVLGMLAMMAMHDIMKMTPLLPKVGKSVKEYHGYKAGETINDHDVALSYILDHHPDLLPSFSGLPKAQQDSIRFAHCKMEYNMGWLVQAEAPPGALFRQMRKVSTSGRASPRDVAFYFVHWFVDLAAAEPCPIAGCTKFVLMFPQRVLMQFLDSFSVVQAISEQTETQVLEEYYRHCWYRHDPELGAAPRGNGSIAKMRLMLMSQGDTIQILEQFDLLSLDDQQVLGQEMACTGCRGQQFEIDDLEGYTACGRGPAILVYYGPALMQKPGKKDPKGALTALAEVYRRTRELWPLTEEEADKTVTVRIDAIKDLDAAALMRPDQAQTWVVCKNSGMDATVKALTVSQFKDLDWRLHAALQFGAQRKAAFRKQGTFKLAGKLGDLGQRVRRFSLRAVG